MGALEWFSFKTCFGGCSSLRQTARTFFIIQMVLSAFMFIVCFCYMIFSDLFGGFPHTGLIPFRSTWYSLALLLVLSVADFVFSYMAHAATFNDTTEPLGMFCASRGFSLAAYLILFYLTTQWNGSEIMVAMAYLMFAGCSIYLASALYLAETLHLREYEPLDGESQATGGESASVSDHSQQYQSQSQLQKQYEAQLAYASTQPHTRHSAGVVPVQYGLNLNSQRPGPASPVTVQAGPSTHVAFRHESAPEGSLSPPTLASAARSAPNPAGAAVNRGAPGGSNTTVQVVPLTFRPDPKRDAFDKSQRAAVPAAASASAPPQRAAAAKASGRPSVAV